MAKPKVFSLLKTDKMNNYFLNVSMLGRPTDIFVRCASYDLKLPVNGQKIRTLDIFEEAVLRMLKVKKCTVSELADILCLEKDLVHFIIIRLQEKGLLEDNYTLSEVGEKQLNFQKEQGKEVEYQAAKLFIVDGCDVVLPYVFVGEFITEDVVEFGPTSITLGFGSVGDQKKVTGSRIKRKKKEKENKISVLPQATIKNAIKKYNKLAVKRKKNRIVLADGYTVESTRGEDIYFHMQAAVQVGNTEELLVSDGFVSNVDGLSGYIKSMDPDIFMRVQSKAVHMDTEESRTGDSAPWVYTGKYPEVVRYCKDMDKYVHKLSEESSIDDIRQNEEDKRQVIINCYSMLEWAFHYCSLKNSVSDPLLQVFKRQKAYENFDTIKNLAIKIGVNYLDDCSGLFTNFDGRKAEMTYETSDKTAPVMQIVLPLAIIGAAEDDDSAIRVLLAKDYRFISFIHKVGKLAGNFRHDSTAKAGDIKADKIRDHAVDIVTTILPDIQLSRDEEKAAGHVSNERLKAIVGCEKVLGSQLYFSLNEGIQDDFRRISPDKGPAQLPAPYEYIQVLYRILQTIFYEEDKRYMGGKWMTKEECIKKNEELLGKKLPKSLETVKENSYNTARRGLKATLGAHCLVLLSDLSQEDLGLLMEQDVIGVVDKILEYREHANNISLMVSDAELSNLRGKVINITKILGGYYNGQ